MRSILALLVSSTVSCHAGSFDYPFPGRVIVDDHWGGEISAVGGPCYPWNGVDGCAPVGVRGTCRINIVGGLGPARVRALIRHEVCHCNGLNESHSNGTCGGVR